MPSAKSPFYLPAVDIRPWLENPESESGKQVIQDIRSACVSTGFFQLLGHGISPSLQQKAFDASAKFFALPRETKLAIDKSKSVGFRGYDGPSLQAYESDVLPDLREGFISGIDLPLDDPRVEKRRFFCGQNQWPSKDALSRDQFRQPIEEYYDAMMSLCGTVLDLVAATLPYGPRIFDEFRANQPACPFRLLHYPPTPTTVAGQKRQLGSSAHTDFGAVTLLLQDEHAGLEVLDRDTNEWVGVPPNKDAYVINMGDMMSKITGNLYKSSVHRVINKSLSEDRYSIVFFFDGNIDYKLKRLDGSSDQEEGEVPTAEQYVFQRVAETYRASKE